ncbi:hypothetical protein LUCX_87 [Xanthomonas phage vB_XciM_LucasX]|nr:hypothetical protein LUCX_87 [Xanthomonas phage vB_XciM_LucasX]
MKINARMLTTHLLEAGIGGEAQAGYLQSAVARVIGYLLPIPSEPVEVLEHIKGSLEDVAAKALDAVLEVAPLDHDATMELIFQVWKVRYNLVHPSISAPTWKLLDIAASQGLISAPVSFADPLVQRLGALLSKEMEG